MTIAGDPWDVNFSRTTFLMRILDGHENVRKYSRSQDIYFEIERINQRDTIWLLGCDEYALSLAVSMRAIQDFDPLNIIFIGGNWNGYSQAAKEYCTERHIGVFNASEISGGLWSDEYWDYAQKDDKGNREYHYRG